MNFHRPRRRAALGLSMMLVGGALSINANPVFAAADGAPVIETLAPQSGPTSGGIPVRIYGDGFVGTTSVKFGAVAATKFAVISRTLLTAVVPAAAGGTADDNTFVDVTVTDGEGTNTLAAGFYYTNASLTVTPSTGLHPGDAITVGVIGYAPNTDGVVVELNPLQIYLENGPPFPPGPPPYVDPLAFTTTSSSGAVSLSTTLSNPFNSDGVSYDDNAVCPLNQTTANFLGNSPPASLTRPSYSAKCLIPFTQFAMGSLDTPISFTTDPVPGAPVLQLTATQANQGETVKISTSSVNWNANPFFGSSKAGNKPGETKVRLEICGIGGNPSACSTKLGNGKVSLTRYINKVFSGARLSGTIVVGSDVPSGCSCFVRARQYRPAGGFIEATAPLTIT